VREINQRLVDGKWIRMAFGDQARDRQGHLLAYVWVDDVFVNAALLQKGYAEAAASTDHQYLAYFRTLEEDARRDGRDQRCKDKRARGQIDHALSPLVRVAGTFGMVWCHARKYNCDCRDLHGHDPIVVQLAN